MSPYHLNAEGNESNPWQPQRTCPYCGSTNLRIGCQFADCEECDDVEQSTCLSCGVGFGGANYWATPGIVKAT